MRRKSPILAALTLTGALAGCANALPPAPPGIPAFTEASAPIFPWPQLPRGASLGPGGYVTLLAAPPSPTSSSPRFAPGPPETDERYRNPDPAAMRDAQALDRRLRTAERDTYIGYRVVRDPTPRFAFQFRRDAAAALARHTRDPRFTSREGGVPTAELQPIFDEWFPRLVAQRLIGGGGVMEFEGVAAFDMTVDAATFGEIAAAEGWVLPERLQLNFGPPPNLRAIDPALIRLVRIVPRSDRLAGAVNSAALSGRIVLRDGCFRLADHGSGPEPLVLFDRDAEIGLDADTHMTVTDGDQTVRIGEPVIWAGPRSANEADAGVQALRAQCGEGPIIPIGAPSSAAHFPPR